MVLEDWFERANVVALHTGDKLYKGFVVVERTYLVVGRDIQMSQWLLWTAALLNIVVVWSAGVYGTD